MYVCAPHACSSSRDLKKVSDPLELALQAVVSCHVGAGSRIQVLRFYSAVGALNG